MAKVSVIMPAYNVEKYVSEAMESILNQTYQDFEFLIFNDGSTDRTADVIEAFEDTRIKFFNYKQNSGYVKHLNYGIEIAEGKYIARMDADDISHPDRLRKQIDFMEANPEVGVCGGYYETIGDSSDILEVPSEDDDLKIYLLFDSAFGHPTVIMRTNVLRDYKLFYDNDFMPAEDYKMWVELSRVSKLANLNEILLYYRLHEGQISNHKKQVQSDRVQAVRELQVEYLLSNGLTAEERRMVVFLFGYPESVCEPKFFTKTLEWAKKLIQINSDKKVYVSAKFEKAIVGCVKNLMYRTKYDRSLLFSNGKTLLFDHLSQKEKIKFYLKCLLNWQPSRTGIL